MPSLEPRQILDELIKERRESYASVSRLLSRNPAYIQQFIKRGSPLRLDESDIVQLSLHFGVPAAVLGGEVSAAVESRATVAVPVLMGSDAEDPAGHVRLFDEMWLRTISRKTSRLSVVIVEGDAMQPTLKQKDEVLIERHVANEQLRDGIYAIRADARLLIRRVALEPARNRISVLCDNPVYPASSGLPKRSVQIVGRVIWAGLQIG